MEATRARAVPPATREMKAVWDSPSGTILTARKTLHMIGEEAGPPVFTEGRTYRVVSMHPIAREPFVKVINDKGGEHCLEGAHLLDWFRRA